MSAVGIGPAAPVHVLVGPQLVLVEVGLVEVAARLQHQHLEARRRERGGDHAAAGPRAHHHRVGLQSCLVALGHDRHDRPLPRLGQAARPGIAEGGPERVHPGLRVGHAVGEEEAQLDEALSPGGGLGAERREVAQELLARAGGGGQEAHLDQAVEKLLEALALHGGELLDRLGHCLVGAQVAATPRPEAVRIGAAVDPRHDGVRDCPQHLAAGLVHGALPLSLS